jgi:hypothetical protein
VLQYGRQRTYIQWCKILKDDNSAEIVIMEVGEIVIGATAEEFSTHVEATWDRGQTAME